MDDSLIPRRACAAALLLGLLCTGGYLQAKTKKPVTQPEEKKKPLDKADIYLPSIVQWERPGAANPNDWSSARTRVDIAVFYPGGEFIGGNIAISRLPDGELVAQPQDDYSLRKGTWTRNGKEIVVQSQWVKFEKQDAPKKKRKIKPVKETWVTDPKVDKHLAHYLVIGATEYVQADALQNLDALEGMFH